MRTRHPGQLLATDAGGNPRAPLTDVTRAAERFTRVAALAASLVVLTGAFAVWSLDRSPLPDIDETYIASAAAALSRGESGVPSVLAQGTWNVDFERAYGPIFFRLVSVSIRMFGLSAVSVRAVCLFGASLAAVAAGWMVRRAGAAPSWAVVAGAIVWLSPLVGSAASNGRMDSLAAGLEVLATALIVIPNTERSRTAAAHGGASGVCLALAVLCTPRALLFAAALPFACVLVAVAARSVPRSAIIACGTATVVSGGLFLLWLTAGHVSPAVWLRDTIAGTSADIFNSVVGEDARVWSMTTVSAVDVCVIASLLGVTIGIDKRTRGACPWTLWLVVAWTLINGVLYIVRVNHTFFRGIYFLTPLLAAALAWSAATVHGQPGRARVVVASWAAVLALYTGARLMKSAEVVATWAQRDPAGLEAFFRMRVPRGSLVYGFDQFYFYAIERSGSRFETYVLSPFAGSPTIGRPPAGSVASLTKAMAGHYFVWPDDAEHFPMPDALRCVLPYRVGSFDTPPPALPVLHRISAFGRYAYLHGYPRTGLFRIPQSCPAD